MKRLLTILYLLVALVAPIPASYDFGTAITDRINTSSPQSTTVRTYSIWMWRDGDGGTSLGHVWSGQFDTNRLSIVSGTLMQISFDWTTTDGNWRFTKPSISSWHHIAVTYDASLTTNDPAIYVDGMAAPGFVEITAPVGTFAPSGNWMLGNHNGNSVNWDGKLAEGAIWSRILTAGEITSLARGFSPAFMPNGLAVYYPLVRELRDRKVATLAVATGAAPAEHPRIVYPALLDSGIASTTTGGAIVNILNTNVRRRRE